jgi:hypothetical protein
LQLLPHALHIPTPFVAIFPSHVFTHFKKTTDYDTTEVIFADGGLLGFDAI